MRKRAGSPSNQVVPVSAVAPAGDGVGLKMSTFEAIAGGKPDDYLLKVMLAGGADVELVLHMRGIAGDWGVAGDTGNLGMLGGQKLTSNKNYFFPVSGIAAAAEVALLAQNNNGGVVVTAVITPVVDSVQG
jgi:hypothetical protein